VKVALASSWPLAVHRLPMWMPVLAAALEKRIPVAAPGVPVWNLTPTSSQREEAQDHGEHHTDDRTLPQDALGNQPADWHAGPPGGQLPQARLRCLTG